MHGVCQPAQTMRDRRNFVQCVRALVPEAQIDGKGPAGTTTLILGSEQMALQIHESVGHATEYDRAIGYEAAYAGTSFATPDLLGTLRYGSPLMHVTGKGTLVISGGDGADTGSAGSQGQPRACGRDRVDHHHLGFFLTGGGDDGFDAGFGHDPQLILRQAQAACAHGDLLLGLFAGDVQRRHAHRWSVHPPGRSSWRLAAARGAFPGRRLVLGNGDVRISYVVADAANGALANTVRELRNEYVIAVRGTVQADILKEDQAQNTCIFSTEFSLRVMGDVQEYFVANGVLTVHIPKATGALPADLGGWHEAVAGCTYVQMDDTNLAYLCDDKMREAARTRGDDPNELPRRYARLINAAIKQKEVDERVVLDDAANELRILERDQRRDGDKERQSGGQPAQR